MRSMTMTPIRGLPLILPGDDLTRLIAEGLLASSIVPVDGDVVVVAQKIVSKAENRYVSLRDVEPSPRAKEVAAVVGKDPRLVEVILSESVDVLRIHPGVLITEHRLGFVMANAGVDQSNIDAPDSDERALRLPIDPDRSSALLKQGLDAVFGVNLGVVINDSFGRPWRQGVVGVALGVAGLPALVDRVGQRDLFGRSLQITQIAVADAIAAAASLVMGEADEGIPCVHLRGAHLDGPPSGVQPLLRPRAQDLFR